MLYQLLIVFVFQYIFVSFLMSLEESSPLVRFKNIFCYNLEVGAYA